MRFIGLDVHRDWCDVAIYENGSVRSCGRVPTAPDKLELFALDDPDERTSEAMLARVAWHEWAHALAVARADRDDVAAGERLLELAPEGIRGLIRQAGYRRGE